MTDRTPTLKLFSPLLAISFLFVFFTIVFSAPPAQARGENFESVPCSTFKISSDEFQCGYVTVPEFHAQPNGKQLKLAVAILPSTGSSPTRDAFVVAQGGPGGSTLDTFASFFQPSYFPALKDIRAERDVVLYDQRGTLYSQPALLCPEELQNTLATIAEEISPQESLNLSEQAALACRARLVQEGVNLDAYNSFENALDIEAVRRALGYDKFDFYGVSYGTLLALHGLREAPDTFRSVILDAVVPAQKNPNSSVAESQNRAFEQLFSACAADEECNRAYPNLKQVFYAQVDALNQKPARINLTDSKTQKTYNAVIDGDSFMDLLFQFIYNTELVPALPQMIYDARGGSYGLIETFYPLLLFDRTFASGMYYSVMCSEDADFTVNDLELDGVDPHIAQAQTRDTAAFLQLCQKWNVPQLGARADEPVTAQVPTLVLSGDYDPITPPPFGQAAAETITPSYVYEFPAYGHGAMTSGNCPNEMIAAFVQNLGAAPNASCIKEDATRVTFITPVNWIHAAGIGKMNLAILQANLEFFLAPIFLLAFLLTIFVLGPLFWLVRYSQKRPSEPNLFARLAPWLIAFASLIAAAFFLSVLVLLIVAALQNENTIGLALGAPRAWWVIYLIPPSFSLCAILFTLAIVLAWRRGNWIVPQRVYYSMLAVAAMGMVVWFAWHGLLFAFVN